MADSLLLFDVFGDHSTRNTTRNVLRQPLSNENFGKALGNTVPTGPLKPNEPMKKDAKLGEPKKSFLSNAGKSLLNTPSRKMFSPMPVNQSPMISMIYTEEKMNEVEAEDIKFTKNKHTLDTFSELFHPMFRMIEIASPPATPPPRMSQLSCELAIDDFSDFGDSSIDSLQFEDLGLPDPY